MSSFGTSLNTLSKTINEIKNLIPTLPSSRNISISQPPNSSSPLVQSTLSFPTISTSKCINPYKRSKTPATPTPSIQTKLSTTYSTDFQWIGERMTPLPKKTARIWIQNVHKLDISNNFNIFMEQLDSLRLSQINILCLSEAGLNPRCPYVRDNISAAVEMIYPGSHYQLTNTRTNDDDLTQSGGLFSFVSGPLATRYAGGGSDRIGSFNWIDFYGKNNYLRIYTVYRVNPGNVKTSGDDTAWRHQHNLLTELNITTDPRDHITKSLVKLIKEDIRLNRNVLVCGDVNENVLKKKGFSAAMEAAGLINIVEQNISTNDPIRSYANGSSIIDGVWGTVSITDFILNCGFAPFQKIFKSDHRGFFLDLDITSFLDESFLHLPPAPYRRLKYTIPSRVKAYSDTCLKQWKSHNMQLKIEQLPDILTSLGDNRTAKALILNKLDKSINDMMTHSEKKCCMISRHCSHQFSVPLKKALRNHRQLGQLLSKTIMYMQDGMATSTQVSDLARQKREAKKELKKCQKSDDSLRESLFAQLAQETVTMHPQRGAKKSSILKQLKHCEGSRKDSTKIRIAMKGPRQAGISYVLIPALTSYDSSLSNDPLFNHYDPEIIWQRTSIANGNDINEWERVDDFSIVSPLIIHFLRRHFGQSSSTPFANNEWVQKLRDADFQELLLNGSFTNDNSLTPAANALLRSFSRTHPVQDIALLPKWSDFTSFIKNTKEKTSASPSTRHYGHYKSLLHSCPSILKGIFQILCLALEHGIVLDRWKKTITTLLCKDNNVPKIHRLRPIHIVEVELQFFSKSQWSRSLINKAEQARSISSSQYGGRKNRQAQSSVINTITCFDIHRQQRKPFSFNDDDLRANYDRELAHLSAAETRKHGLSHKAGNLLIDITQSQQFYIKTINGVSDTFYSYEKDFPIWGLGQGISWAGSCWQFTATTIETILRQQCKGAVLEDPEQLLQVFPFLKFFIDDTTKICNSTGPGRTLLQQACFNMQLHYDLVHASGGDLALDKCKFFLIDFRFDNNHNPYIATKRDNPGDLQIKNVSGDPITITRLESNEARKTLGCFISPSFNQLPQLTALQKMAKSWTSRIVSSSLQNHLRIKAYHTILVPQMTYRLSTSSLSFEQCDSVMKILRPVILNSFGIQRNFPKSILEADPIYAGLAIKHLYDVQGYEKLKFFKYHLHHLDETGTNILISMKTTQLELGISEPFYNCDFYEFEHLLTPTWTTHLWQYLTDRELRLDISHDLVLLFPRANDSFIMPLLLQHFSKIEMSKINKVRLSMQLTFLSDIADFKGQHILPDIRLGKSYRKYQTSFPRQTYSPTWLKLWNKACDHLQSFLSRNKLGCWFGRKFTCLARLSACRLWLSFNDHLYYRQRLSSSFSISEAQHHFLGNETDIYFSKGKLSIIPTRTSAFIPRPPSRLTNVSETLFGSFTRDDIIEKEIYDAIKSNTAKMSCDGSMKDTLGSFAYGLAPSGSDTFLFQNHAPIHGDPDQLSSTRCELMGLLACVSYLDYFCTKYPFSSRPFVLITADNLAAVRAPRKTYKSIKYAFLNDGDIIWTLINTIAKVPLRIRINHIKGHQDNKKSYNQLSTLAKLNVLMDAHAKRYFSEPENAPEYSIHSPFLPFETVSLYDEYSRIVNKIPTNLTRMTVGYDAEVQLAATLQISFSSLQYIDWKNLLRARKSLPPYQQIQMTKLIHKQLPVMYRAHKWKQSENPLCPLCQAHDETMEHLLQCKCLSVHQTRLDGIKNIKNFLSDYKTDPILQRNLLRMIHQFTHNYPISPPPPSTTITSEMNDALNTQISLGINNMLRGIVTWKLAQCQQTYYRSIRETRYSGDTWIKNLILKLVSLFRMVWKRRCDLVVANSTSSTYEGRIRNNCTTLFHSLSNDPSKLPASLRYLLQKSGSFFQKARVRALNSWLKQVQKGMKTPASLSSSDIRNWIQPTTQDTSSSLSDDSDNDSEMTDDWFSQYPDEDPTLDTWDTFKRAIEETHHRSSPTNNTSHLSKNTISTSILTFFQPRKK